MEEIAIVTPTIQLDQFLKWVGVVESGGQVKLFIEDGLIKVNGLQVHERRKKIKPSDIVEVEGIGIWKVTAE